MPVIRKLWPKFALRAAVKEEAAKSPRFIISYTRPYMFRGTENGTEERVYLPRGLKNGAVLSDAGKKEFVKHSSRKNFLPFFIGQQKAIKKYDN